jgi:hypothetical protein
MIKTVIKTAADAPGLGCTKAKLDTLNPAARKAGLDVVFEGLRKALPCADDAAREALGKALFFFAREDFQAPGAQAVARGLLGDALKSGDVQTAIESVARFDLPLSKPQTEKLVRGIQRVAANGDAETLLSSRDWTLHLARPLVRVLATEPGALAQFARALPSPQILVRDVIVNDERKLEKALLELSPILSPKQARDLIAPAGVKARFPELFRALQARSTEAQ